MKIENISIKNVTLETERLILRAFNEGDLQDFHAYASVEGVGEAAGWAHHTSLADTKKVLDIYIASNRTFAIVEKCSGRVIGSFGIENSAKVFRKNYSKNEIAEIGYVLARDRWGLGLMPEAVMAVLDYLFGEFDFRAVGCGHFAENLRSRRVIEKCGFSTYGVAPYKTQMGTTEKSQYYVMSREQYYVLTREDYLENRARG
jgi:ribosomal-protein-alanine N-acetyltransferase